MGPVSGAALAQLILGEQPEIDLTAFAPPNR
jgi:glycine/D-amino acid oxidase-like deaminating enzyme